MMPRTRHIRAILPLVLFAITSRLLVIALVPMWQSPDESAHAAVIASWTFDEQRTWFERSARAPLIFRQAYDWGDESLNLLQLRGNVANAAARPDFTPDSLYAADETLLHQSADASTLGIFGSSMVTYPQLYYWSAAAFTKALLPPANRSFLNTMFVARGTGILFAVAMAIIAYAIGFELTATVTGGYIVAFLWLTNGLFLQMSATLNAEAPLYPLVAFSFWCTCRIITRGRIHPAAVVALCLTIVTAAFTKPNGLLCAAVPLGILALWPLRQIAPTIRTRILLLGILAAGATAMLFERTHRGPPMLNGDPSGWAATSIADYLHATFVTFGPNILRNWIGQYGWYEVTHSVATYAVIYAALALAIIPAFVIAPADQCHIPARRALSFMLLTFVATLILTHIYHFGWLLPKVGYIFQGRYIGFTFFVIYAVAGVGIANLAQSRRLFRFVAAALLLIFAWQPLDACRQIIARFYDPSGLSELITRASQWSPVYLKGNWLIALLASAILAHLFAVIVAMRHILSPSHKATTPDRLHTARAQQTQAVGDALTQ